MFLRNQLQTFNHAFMVGRGTKSAIEDMISNVMKAKYVYEFDLKGFFDNVPIFGTVEKLRKLGMPIDICIKLASLLLSTPSNIFKIAKKELESGGIKGLIQFTRRLATATTLYPRFLSKAIMKETKALIKLMSS